MDVPSGAKVVINLASWGDAMALKNAVAREVAASKTNISLQGMGLNSDVNIGEFLNVALSVDSSAEVNKALMACLLRCTYNGEKITNAAFEPAEARQDYYPIVMECLRINLADFFKPLVSKFFALLAKIPSKSVPPSK